MLKCFKTLNSKANHVFGNGFIAKAKHSGEGTRLNSTKNEIQNQKTREYPNVKQLSLPINYENVISSENLKFSPSRNRDINGLFISSSASARLSRKSLDIAANGALECYDCSGAINLSSAMQTNVPQPYITKGKTTHLNMPGSQWPQRDKFMAGDLNRFHKTNVQNLNKKIGGISIFEDLKNNKVKYFYLFNRDFTCCSSNLHFDVKPSNFKYFCTKKEKTQVLNKSEGDVSQSGQSPPKQKFKNAVKDYGIVIVVLQGSFSLISLGCCYLAVASGVAGASDFTYWGVDEGATTAGVAAVFVTAYAIHKSMAPWRLLLTLIAAPFTVKKLRKIGLLKPFKQ